MGRLFGFYRMAGSFVGAPGDYLGMTVDVVVTSARRVGASSSVMLRVARHLNLSSSHALSFQQLRTAEATLMLDPSSTHAKTSLCNIDLLIILVVGLVAGWLAGQIVRAIGFGVSVTSSSES